MAQDEPILYCKLQYNRHFLYTVSADHLVKNEVFCSSTKTTTITTIMTMIHDDFRYTVGHVVVSSLLPFSCYLCHPCLSACAHSPPFSQALTAVLHDEVRKHLIPCYLVILSPCIVVTLLPCHLGTLSTTLA